VVDEVAPGEWPQDRAPRATGATGNLRPGGVCVEVLGFWQARYATSSSSPVELGRGGGGACVLTNPTQAKGGGATGGFAAGEHQRAACEQAEKT
jgi:hypothetical protein